MIENKREETESFSLGGGRQSPALDNEISYPLTEEEFQQFQDNLNTDKLTNTEAFLFSIGATLIISAIIFYFTTTFTKEIVLENCQKIIINYGAIIIISIYGGLGLGMLSSGFIIKKIKKKSKRSVDRLATKILKHYGK